MKVAVIGAGAIGCVIGALLQDNGHDVTLAGRDDQVSAIAANGLTIDGVLGERTYRISAKKALDYGPDALILAVKTQDVDGACRAALPYAKGALAITMQNGVRGDEAAASVLGNENIISAVVMYGATYVEPGRVTYNFPGSGLVIGKAFGDDGAGLTERASELFRGSFAVHISEDIHGAHWSKLILNLSNALAGVLGRGLNEIFDDPAICRLGIMLMREAYQTMRAAGIRLAGLPDLPLEKLAGLLEAPVEVSSGIYGNIMKGLSKEYLPGSILQSIRRGRPSEVDYLNGEIVLLAGKNGGSAPINKKAAELVKRVEQQKSFLKSEELLREMAI